MLRSWCSASRWIAIGVAAWLAGGGVNALLPARAAEPMPSAAGRPAAIAVANPFAEGIKSFPRRPASPLGLKTTAWIPTTGSEAEGDTTALYRLPGASSFAPAPAEPFVENEVPPIPTVALPTPPLEMVVVPLVRTADARSDDIPPVTEPSERAESNEDVSSATPQAEVSEPKVSIDDEWPSFDESTSAPSTPWPAGADCAANEPVGGVSDADRGQRPLPQTAPMTAELTPQLLPAVRRGYALAQRGAMYAARAEFVQVLGRVVQAKDAAANSDAHSQALAAGLRAIDEAEDFVPSGVRVEAELDVRIVASSHRTPVLGAWTAEVSPHEALALYHRYAQQQLAAAVAGEQAGSMALHGLGKVSATLAERGSGDPALVRSSMTMYSAALATCPLNHLAANELGVLLVREGRAEEAARLFERTIDLAPSATAYHNLAIAQGKLGFHGEAAANEQESQRLAATERATGAVSRRAGIEWVTPDEMSGVAQPGLTPTAQVPPQPRSAWQKTVDMAKSLPLVGGTKTR